MIYAKYYIEELNQTKFTEYHVQVDSTPVSFSGRPKFKSWLRGWIS
jgi:hypothetical protein